MMSSRKPLTVLFVGFAIGFILGIIVLSPSEEPLPLSENHKRQTTCNHPPEKKSQVEGTYASWLANQGAVRNSLDIDDFLYGKGRKQAILEADMLKDKVHITCIVFVEREKNVIAASHTWLKHCNDYELFHAKRPQDHRLKEFAKELRVQVLEVASSWDFLCKIILSLWKSKGPQLQWLLFVSDDMFVVPENLRRMVAHVNPDNSFYLGHAQTLWGQPYNVALAGYALSKGTIRLLAGNFSSFESCSSGGKYWKKEDYYLGT